MTAAPVLALVLGAALIGCASGPEVRSYDCQYAVPALTLDGRLDDAAWAAAPWTEDFIDIVGDSKPRPRYRTRAKMLWDDQYLYIAAEMEEPDLWAVYTKRDEIVFHQHDFEVFIDPNADSREYYELEVNVLGTIFDLYLHRAYRDGGPAEHGWDSAGLVTAITVDGSINDHTNEDQGWKLEWAIPWVDLQPPAAHRATAADTARGGKPPQPGQEWRINFSRVEWGLVKVDQGGYEKIKDAPEDNWVWSPQGVVDMHQPEHWGRVRFVGPPTVRIP